MGGCKDEGDPEGRNVKKVYRKPVLRKLGLLRYGLDAASTPD
jgi:hypothetical protein